ncbi:hypothetical protein LCGC14_1156430 [marine sediment metagenome]|uniref:Uncharacterized protein n=1 Tax=marine sediment metagenome TaxID=412755 RepID=A0A0F9PC62_9ZZZZ
MVEVPVPNGFEVWFTDFMLRCEERRRLKLHERRKSKVSAGRVCWSCKVRLIAQGASGSQRYAREQKLCKQCYLEGVRRAGEKGV